MNSLLEKVTLMHCKFRIVPELIPFTKEEKEFRFQAMLEEITEYHDAENAEEEFDALIDLMVFALGTVDRQGWSDVFDEGFARVMRANLDKELGPNTGKERGSFQLDLFKPEGWVPPCHKDLVGE